MTILDQETIPGSIAGVLTDEQRQAIIEAPREKRLETLAAALGRPDSEVLQHLATTTGLDVASNLETDPFRDRGKSASQGGRIRSRNPIAQQRRSLCPFRRAVAHRDRLAAGRHNDGLAAHVHVATAGLAPGRAGTH